MSYRHLEGFQEEFRENSIDHAYTHFLLVAVLYETTKDLLWLGLALVLAVSYTARVISWFMHKRRVSKV